MKVEFLIRRRVVLDLSGGEICEKKKYPQDNGSNQDLSLGMYIFSNTSFAVLVHNVSFVTFQTLFQAINASNSRDLLNFSPEFISSSRRNKEETLTMSQKHVCLWLWCSRRSIISLVRRVRKTA